MNKWKSAAGHLADSFIAAIPRRPPAGCCGPASTSRS